MRKTAARDALIAFLAEQIVEEIVRACLEDIPLARPQVATPEQEAQNPAEHEERGTLCRF